jgi:hypothetical protein
MIKCIRNHGISIKFDNGFTVNIMFGKHNSCERFESNHRNSVYSDWENSVTESFTAEVTVTDGKDRLVPFNNSESLKYQTAKDIADILFKASIAQVADDMYNFDLSRIRKEEEWE